MLLHGTYRMLRFHVQALGHQAGRGGHARHADKTLNAGVKGSRRDVCPVAQNLQARRPALRDTGLLPLRKYSTKRRVAGGKVLCPVVALPVINPSRTHASRCSATFFKYRDFYALLLQVRGTGQTSHTSANDCNMQG